jgi:hypothetical protein
MTATLTAPSFNNRLADSYAQTRTLDKTLKFSSSFASLVSNLLSYTTSENAAISGKAISSLGKTFSSVRSGVKVFDVLQDFSTPTGDIHEKRMKWIQMVCFASADATNPVFFFENQGFYSIDSQTKEQMGNIAAGFGLTGVATSLVNASYQLSKAFGQYEHVQALLNQHDVSQETVEGLTQQHQQLETELANLKRTLQSLSQSLELDGDAKGSLEHDELHVSQDGTAELDLSETVEEEGHGPAATLLQEPTPTRDQISGQIEDLTARIQDLNGQIQLGKTLLIGEQIASEKVLKQELTIIEKIMDIAAIVLSLASTLVVPSVFVPVMAGLGLISSAIALAKIWRESGISREDEAQLKIAMNMRLSG